LTILSNPVRDALVNPRRLEIIILLGALNAFAPLSIDMYLPSLPLLERVFGATTAEVQRTLAAFLLGFALGQLLYGPLADRFGRKPPLYCSLTLFVAASLACGSTNSVGWLTTFRLLQALGACGGQVMARAMVRDLFPPAETRQVFSMLFLVNGVAPVAAPLLGGYLLLWFGWRAIFWTLSLLGLACLTGIHLRLPETLRPGSAQPLHPERILSSYAQLARDRTFMGTSLVCGFASAGLFGYIASAPFVFINLYGVSPQHFGWLFGFIAVGIISASQINGRLLHGVPADRVLRIANVVQFVTGAWLLAVALATARGYGGSLVELYVPLYAYVACIGFVFPCGAALAMAGHGRIAGFASALLGTVQFSIAAVSTILLGTIESASALPMAIVIAVCGAGSILVNVVFLRGHHDAAV
jgi:DHA1 family bicyclomycin/chloramphenicol resistance-like MFS transporter